MNDFISAENGTRKIRKSQIAACMINPNFFDNNGIKRPAISVILNSGEKATLVFDTLAQAEKVFDEID